MPGPDPSELAKVCEAHLRAHGLTGDVSYDAGRDRLRVAGSGPVVHFLSLHGLRREHDDAPQWERGRVLDRWLWSFFPEGAPSKERVLHRLLPRLRDHVYFAVLDRQMRAQLDTPEEWKAAAVPFRALSDSLCVNLVFETPTSISDVTQERLDAWGLSFDDALELAKQNLGRRSQLKLQRLEPGLYTSPFEDGHDPARLLLESTTDGLELHGAPVAMVPSQAALLVAGEHDGKAVQRLLELSKALLQDARSLSGVAYRREGSTWVPWLPEVGHPAREGFLVLALQTLGNAYAHQKDLLEAWHEVTGETFLVSRFSAYRGDDGGIFTVTQWQDGVSCLLPKADRVEFVRLLNDDEAQVWRVDWKVLEATVGPLLASIGETPPRFRTLGFPTDAQLEAMALQSAQQT